MVAAVIVSVVMTAIGLVTVAATQDRLFLGRNISDCKILVHNRVLGLIVFHGLIVSRLFRNIPVFLLKFVGFLVNITSCFLATYLILSCI